MKTPIIGNYNNKYSQNNNRQASASRPNFGLTLKWDEKALGEVVKDANVLQKIVATLTSWGEESHLIQRFKEAHVRDIGLSAVVDDFNPLKLKDWKDAVATLTFKRSKNGVIAYVGDDKNPMCRGHGVSLATNLEDAVRFAADKGLNDYAGNKIFEDMVVG